MSTNDTPTPGTLRQMLTTHGDVRPGDEIGLTRGFTPAQTPDAVVYWRRVSNAEVRPDSYPERTRVWVATTTGGDMPMTAASTRAAVVRRRLDAPSTDAPAQAFGEPPNVDEAARQLAGFDTAAWERASDGLIENYRAEVRRIVDAMTQGLTLDAADEHTATIAVGTPLAVWRAKMIQAAEHPEDCAACAAGESRVHAYEAPETVDTGAYGIEAVDPSTPGAMVCGECGRAWADDITPAGRCPWEADHGDDDDSGRREYRFIVTVTADSADAAGRIIAERLAYDEEYEFPGGSNYEIGYAEEVAR